MANVTICAVCQGALDTVTNADGVSLIHAVQDADDHEVIPVTPDAQWRGRCDFCSHPRADYELPARDFRVPNNDQAMSRGGWSACDVCAPLIERNEWNAIVRRAVTFYTAQHGNADYARGAARHEAQFVPVDAYAANIRALYRKLRQNITGPVRRVDEGGA